MKKIKGDNDFTWKPSWPNEKEKPRPPGISKFSYYVLDNQLQLHKTINNSKTLEAFTSPLDFPKSSYNKTLKNPLQGHILKR